MERVFIMGTTPYLLFPLDEILVYVRVKGHAHAHQSPHTQYAYKCTKLHRLGMGGCVGGGCVGGGGGGGGGGVGGWGDCPKQSFSTNLNGHTWLE